MMLALRGVLVCLSTFSIVYVVLSTLAVLLWRKLWRACGQPSAVFGANVLFVVRIIPLAAAGLVALFSVAPSFALLEPRGVAEPTGLALSILGVTGFAILFIGATWTLRAMYCARRATEDWKLDSCPNATNFFEDQEAIAVRQLPDALPVLTLAGILRPTIWISTSAQSTLTESELNCALRHELAHVRHRDNLKKLLMRLAVFPGMKQLECAWCDAAEMAADEAAVSTSDEAVDLASAMLKLARPDGPGFSAELTLALAHRSLESVQSRVERLLAWDERAEPKRNTNVWLFAVLGVIVITILCASCYMPLLVEMHSATEFLVR